MRYCLICLMIGVCSLVLNGCAGIAAKSKKKYHTVKAPPTHNTSVAVEANKVAEQLMQDGKFSEAEQTLQDALIADVNYGPLHNNIGKIYFHQRKYYLAAWEFEYAIRLMPNMPEPQNNLGLVLEAVNQVEEAAAYFTAAHSIQPQNPQYIGNLARAKLSLDEDDPAVKKLLEQLLLYDTRRDWVCWAQEQLGLGRVTDGGESTEFEMSDSESSEEGYTSDYNHYESDESGRLLPPLPEFVPPAQNQFGE